MDLNNLFFQERIFSIRKLEANVDLILIQTQKNDKPLREVNYRMYTGYLAHNQNGSQVSLCIFTASARFHTVLC